MNLRRDRRTIGDDRSAPIKHGISKTTGTDDAQKSRNARRAVAARRKAADRPEVVVDVFEETDESLVPPMQAAVADLPGRRPEAIGGESTSDAIGPRDPRAKVLMEYRTKTGEVRDVAIDQKRLARWCDERGLWAQARTHWEAVLRLDSKSDEARKRLGFRWRGGSWVFDCASAEAGGAEESRYLLDQDAERLHAQMRCRSKVTVPARGEAVAQVESVRDPRAAGAIWKVFAADVGHHGLIVEILSRFKTREASQMLAALSVYSRDNKAQAAAVATLRGRGADEYGERLVSLMHNPMRVESAGARSRRGPGAGTLRRGRYGELPVLLLPGGGTDVGITGLVFPAPAQRFRDRDGQAVQRGPGHDGQSGPRPAGRPGEADDGEVTTRSGPSIGG